MKTTSYTSGKGLLRMALPALAGLLAGCETTVDLPEPPHTPRIALQYTLSNTPPAAPPASMTYYGYDVLMGRQLFVSSSQRVFDTKPLEGRNDANVEIRDEQGQVVEKFRPTDPQRQIYWGPGVYEPTMGLRGQPGRTYTLHAALPGFDEVESTLTLPSAPVVVSAAYTAYPPAPNTSPSYSRGHLSLTIADDAGTADYYLVFARVLDQQGNVGNWSPLQMDGDNSGNSDFSVGQLRLSNLNSYHGYDIYPYADTDVNGRQFSLSQDVSFNNNNYSCLSCSQEGYVEVIVSKITADTYQFYLSQRRYADADGNPFAEPAPLASNIRPGYGLFGGATDTAYRIKL